MFYIINTRKIGQLKGDTMILLNDNYTYYDDSTGYKRVHGKLYRYNNGLLFIADDGFWYTVALNVFNDQLK